MKYIVIFILGMLISITANGNGIQESDTIGIQKIGETYLLRHYIKPSQDIYYISRRYQVQISEIIKWNPEAVKPLTVGQLLLVPYEKAKNASSSLESTKAYKVKKGEYLFALCRKFKISPETFKEYNKNLGENLKEGQEVLLPKECTGEDVYAKGSKPLQFSKTARYHIVQPEESLYRIALKYNVKQDSIKVWNKLSSLDFIKEGQKLKVGFTEYAVAELSTLGLTQDEKTINTGISGNSIQERGLGVRVDLDSDELVALHATVKRDEEIEVYNEFNGAKVKVKIIGKLPPNLDGKEVIIRISGAACDALGIKNQFFPILLSYSKTAIKP